MAYKYTSRRHPLQPPSGITPLHRVILYDRIGPGRHPCFHCGITVEWRVGVYTQKGALIAEHLDGDHTNNDPMNIVPSCQRCNLLKNSRGVRDNELFIVRDGVRKRATLRSCRVCKAPFLVRTAAIRSNPRKGTYCSPACQWQRPR